MIESLQFALANICRRLCDSCDTTIYGQDEHWVRNNFEKLRKLDPDLDDADDILRYGYAAWVDRRVGYSLENGLYRFTATFDETPSVPTLLTVGELTVVVTNAGNCVFLLEKGVDYYFDTYPRVSGVTYSMRDDLASLSLFASLSGDDAEQPGVWTRDGGTKELTMPVGNLRGHVLQMPVLTATPDVAHFGPTDSPITFSSVLTDCYRADAVSYRWSCSDEDIRFAAPNASETSVTAFPFPTWRELAMSVTASFGTRSLTSSLRMSYGTNDAPQVRLGLSIPKAIPFKGACLPASYSFECDVATNGWLVLECTSGTNRVSLWQSETNVFAFVGSNRIDSESSRSDAFYVYGESRSRSYEDVIWKLSFYSASGETNAVSETSTVFGCYCQPVLDVRISDGSSFFNPCSVKTGEDAWFRADVVPSMPVSNIVWRAVDGSVQFPDGAYGQRIKVRGSSVGDTTLGVTVLDYTDERMKFELEVVE